MLVALTYSKDDLAVKKRKKQEFGKSILRYFAAKSPG
jgi:hypothetical protein